MAKYYVSGYTPPSGVTSSDQVKEYQRQLGVAADGIWGPKTQAAYDAALGNTFSLPPYAKYYDSIMSKLDVPQISVSIPSAEELGNEISAFLRPGVDRAIENRQKTGAANMAELDADAVARGMGSSTFVSSMKAREQSKAESDIAYLESEYAALLAERIFDALLNYEKMALDANMFNAQMQSNATNAALSLATQLYLAELQAQQKTNGSSSKSSGSSSSKSSGSSGGSGGSGKNATPSSIFTASDYFNSLSLDELYRLETETSGVWAQKRDYYLDLLGEFYYTTLIAGAKSKYPGVRAKADTREETNSSYLSAKGK